MMRRLSPVARRRFERFRNNRRGWWSLWLFCGLFVISLCGELIANDKPLVLKYDGELYAITKAILANQGHAIAATETTPAPVQTSPASTSDEVIRAQLQIARDALAAIEAQL